MCNICRISDVLSGPLPEHGGGGRGGEGLSALPLKFFVNVPFFSIRRAFEVPFLKEVTKNVDEN